jgi:hypothetical protein
MPNVPRKYEGTKIESRRQANADRKARQTPEQKARDAAQTRASVERVITYRSPEEHAEAVVSKRERMVALKQKKAAGEPTGAPGTKPLGKKIQKQRKFTEIPAGPLLPPKGRAPVGRFYSDKLDEEAIAARIERGPSDKPVQTEADWEVANAQTEASIYKLNKKSRESADPVQRRAAGAEYVRKWRAEVASGTHTPGVYRPRVPEDRSSDTARQPNLGA